MLGWCRVHRIRDNETDGNAHDEGDGRDDDVEDPIVFWRRRDDRSNESGAYAEKAESRNDSNNCDDSIGRIKNP